MELLKYSEQIYIHNSDFDISILANEIFLTYKDNNPALYKEYM